MSPSQANPRSCRRARTKSSSLCQYVGVTRLDIKKLRLVLEEAADPGEIKAMAAYMKNEFAFLGLHSAELRRVSKPFLQAADDVDGDDLIAFVHQCWLQPEREFRYVGANLTRKHVAKLDPSHLPDVEHFIVTDSWWDTVDSLAAWTVGPLVAANPELVTVMDQWIDDDNLWLNRTAILHQLSYKEATDAERLFRYCRQRADHRDFFARKAIGWALRQYARVDPDAVRRFLADNDAVLSGLSKREALKHL